MKKIFTLLFALILFAGSSWGQSTIFTEGFDGSWTIPSTLSPAWSGTTTANLQWQKNDYTTGWTYPSSGSYSPTGAASTTGSARFHSYGINNGLTSDFITPVINLSAYTAGTNYLEFYHINATGTDNLQVYLSTDGGTTWGSSLITCGVASSWTLHTAIALNTTSSLMKLKFTATSDYGNDDIGLDQVKVYNYNPSGPNLTVLPNTLAFGYVPFGSSSSQQSYVLSGANLTAGPIVVTAPTGFGVSLTNGGPYTSTVSVSYTPPTLANTNIYVRFTPLASGTNYSGNITNVGGSAVSSNVAVTGTSDLFNTYCTSSATSAADEDILNVTVGGINNTSTCSSLAPGPGSVQNMYSNYFYSVAPANLPRSTSPNFSVQVGTCGGNYGNAVKIFIDFNQDGDFADAGEQVYVSPASTSGPHTETGSFAVPAGATLGNTMMRVICKETSDPTSITACGTYSWGETEDYQVTISTPTSPNISVIPDALAFGYVPFGSSSTQQSYILAGTNLTAGPIVVTAPSGYGVSLTNGGPYTSSVSVSYTPPTLSNTNIYVRFTPPAANTTYNGNITNVGGSATRNVAVTGSSDLYSIYCTSTATSTADEDIFNVTLGGINNSSTCSTLAPGPGSVQNMYSNYFYAVAPANLPTSTVQNFSVQIGTCGTYNYNNAIKIFIDFNQNGNFSDAGEQIYVSPSSTSGAHTETGSFTVPADATLGNAMMRIVCVETSTPSSITACGTYSWGETEDYQVSISTTATVITNAATAISSTGATLNATVSANNSSTTVKFEYGTMSAPPFDHSVTLPTQVTGQNSAVNTIITGLQPNTTYYFRAVGTNSNGTTNGSILSFPTTTVAPAVTTNGPTLVGSSFATMNGTATAFNANTTVSFEYGLTPGGPYPSSAPGVPALVTGNTPTDFSATITGLVINTNYYYRAKGVNIAGTTYGIEKTFYTTCVVPPILGAISGPVNVCKTGTGYVFSVVPVPYAFVYYWTFPAGFTITSFPNSNSVTVSISNSAVSGSITVHAASDCGAVGPNSPAFTVTVRDLPVVSITGAAPACQYANNNYTTQAGMTSYVWSVSPDGTITPTSNPNVVSINWALTGAKTVGVIYTNSFGCTAAAPGTLSVTVNAAPVPTIGGINNLCLNSGFYDYTTESGMTGYVWTVSPGGTITAGQGSAVAQVVWNTPGAQYVTVNYNNLSNCSALSATVYNVTVNGLPGNSGAITGSSNVCTGSNGVAYSVPPINNAITYIWSLPAGATIASGDLTNSITVNFAPTAVSGDITVYGNSLCGNGPVSAPFHVTITYSPVAAGPITGAGSVCEGEKDVPYSVSPVTNAAGYVWTLPAGATLASGANTPNITVNFAMGAASGNIFVFGTNFCGHGDISPAFPVVIKPVPKTPFIYAQGDTLFSDIPDGNQWFYQGVAILTANGQSFVARYPGWYWDQVTLDGCASDTSNHIYIGLIGINEPNASSFVVYPVPNDGLFKLSMNSLTAEPFNISIYNNIGITVYTKENVTAKGPTNLVIDLRPISSGVYTMVIRNANNKVVRKIIINR